MENLDMQIIVTTSGELLFRSLLLVLLMVLQMRVLNRGTVILLFVSALPLWFLASEYRNFAVAVGEHSTLSFYTSFLNHWSQFYLAWSVVAVSSLIVFFVKKP